MDRRQLLKLTLGASALTATGCQVSYQSQDSWWQGEVFHILPLVSHQSFNIKISFGQTRSEAPVLSFDNRQVVGQRQDSDGRFWAFRATGLEPNHQYQLQLSDPQGNALCDSWPLRTYPAPEDQANKLRVISFTCAGGPDLPVLPGGKDAFKPVAYRQKLYDLMLQQNPDLIIANGDHVYWDYESWVDNRDSHLGKMAARFFISSYGNFDKDQSVEGTVNEATLKAIADEQIGRTYGVRFRSTPVYFVTDDHDYFDNDDATPQKITFPPSDFHRNLRNKLQALYFPEYIVEETMPDKFPGIFSKSHVTLSSHFGELRYGNLLSALFYDCGGYLSLNKSYAGLIPKKVESWLLHKSKIESTQHLIHVPSHPMGWTAGKWREWYPDTVESNSTYLAAVHRNDSGEKYMWQSGWWSQHQRLLNVIGQQKQRKAMVVSGDLHLLGAGQIFSSGDLDLSHSPVTSILSGPVGVGGLGWLSAARGLAARNPKNLRVSELLAPRERNGFTQLDFSENRCEVSMYQCPEGYVSPEKLTIHKATTFLT